MGSSSWARGSMAATSNPLAAVAALGVLADGGTAMDAALASDAVLGVVQPMSTGVGGDLFCLVDDGREITGFNGSGAAPAALTLDVCAAARDAAAPADPAASAPGVANWSDGLPDTSALAVTVPGGVDGWSQLAGRFGRLGLGAVLGPARAVAADGFPVGRVTARAWRGASPRLRPGSPFPAVMRAGQRFANPALADPLAAIAAGGRDAHYEGTWGKQAVDAVAEAGGVLAAEDLAAHRGEWVAPITGSYRDHDVVELPPNGQGAAVLAALARRDDEDPGGPEDPETVVAVMRAVRAGMQAAYRHVADPRVAPVPEFWRARDTVYLAVGADGMAVSLISSNAWGFGSGICAGGAVLQNRGVGFSLDPSHPNVVAGGKRPFHTIIPGLLRRDGRTRWVVGVMGGPMQPQGHVQVMSHLLDHGRDPQAALDAPRARWLGGDLFALETGFPAGVAGAFEAAGLDVLDVPLHPMEAGGGQVVRIHDDGWLEGGSEPRQDGVAFGR